MPDQNQYNRQAVIMMNTYLILSNGFDYLWVILFLMVFNLILVTIYNKMECIQIDMQRFCEEIDV